MLGKPGIYEAKGEFQLNVTRMIPTAAIGAAQRELERVKDAAPADGLFDRGAEAADPGAGVHRRGGDQHRRRRAAGRHHRHSASGGPAAGSWW